MPTGTPAGLWGCRRRPARVGLRSAGTPGSLGPAHRGFLYLQPNKVTHEAKGLRLLCAEDEQGRSCWLTAFRLLKVPRPHPALGRARPRAACRAKSRVGRGARSFSRALREAGPSPCRLGHG